MAPPVNPSFIPPQQHGATNPSSAGSNTTLPKPPIIDSDGQIWFEACSAEGKTYYFNAKTRETKWTKPGTEKEVEEKEEKVGDLLCYKIFKTVLFFCKFLTNSNL